MPLLYHLSLISGPSPLVRGPHSEWKNLNLMRRLYRDPGSFSSRLAGFDSELELKGLPCGLKFEDLQTKWHIWPAITLHVSFCLSLSSFLGPTSFLCIARTVYCMACDNGLLHYYCSWEVKS